MQQQRVVPSDTRLPLPPPVALDIVLATNILRDNMTWTLAALTCIERFRALLAVCVNYSFFCRAEIGTRCLTGELRVDRPSQHICMFVRRSKGDQRRDSRDKLVLAVPITASPVLADLPDSYLTRRIALCTTYDLRLTANDLPMPLSEESHLWNPPRSGRPPQHLRLGWPSRSVR
jgi:hypothetical protein